MGNSRVVINGCKNEHVCKITDDKQKQVSGKQRCTDYFFSLSGLVQRVQNNYEEHVFYHLINMKAFWLVKSSILHINALVYLKTTERPEKSNKLFKSFLKVLAYLLTVKRGIRMETMRKRRRS